MDAELKDELSKIVPMHSEQEFMSKYELAHQEKFNEVWKFSKKEIDEKYINPYTAEDILKGDIVQTDSGKLKFTYKYGGVIISTEIEPYRGEAGDGSLHGKHLLKRFKRIWMKEILKKNEVNSIYTRVNKGF